MQHLAHPAADPAVPRLRCAPGRRLVLALVLLSGLCTARAGEALDALIVRDPTGAGALAGGIEEPWEASLSPPRLGLDETGPDDPRRLHDTTARWRRLGNAAPRDDRWPQITLGSTSRRTRSPAAGAGPRSPRSTELYLAATKVWLGGVLGRHVVVDLALRHRPADRFDLPGPGGGARPATRLLPEASVALLLHDDLAVGLEWRRRQDPLDAWREDSAADVFVAWWPNRQWSLSAASLHLGQIGDKPAQRGWYLSAQTRY